ncbi:MAG: polymer-forming cytoskeletal protein [Candidatus Margulisbacteria bacterium]|nr:polymer-forming cytoskeletal protein [Candidatus Margulisiibacteriota bacterium]
MGLFGGENKPISHGAVDTIIGASAKFKGEIVSSGSVSVNGEFEGKLLTEGELIIAKGSKVVGDVKGGSVIVCGQVDGNIVATNSLEIAKTGRVHGDLVGGKIIIEEGSSYRGRVKVEGEAEAASPVAEESTAAEDQAPATMF